MQQFPQEISHTKLSLSPLQKDDADFIFALLNSSGWKQFIGDRSIHNLEDALHYINKINNNDKLRYWKCVESATGNKLGVVTLIQRDYLQHIDLGFALLPEFHNKGYAKAASLIIIEMLRKAAVNTVAAISIPENTSSIFLLEALGFKFIQNIEKDNEQLFHFELNLLPPSE